MSVGVVVHCRSLDECGDGGVSMDSTDKIVAAACSRLPLISEARAKWAHCILSALVPVALEASLKTEESARAVFSLAVVDFPMEYRWDGYTFEESVDCTPVSVLKYAALTKVGETYLIARLVEGRLVVVGVGSPPQGLGLRLDSDLAAKLGADHGYMFVSATVLGPGSVLFEGMSTELAFVCEGRIQDEGELLSCRSARFLSDLKSSASAIDVGGQRKIPAEVFLPTMGATVLERLVRGAWFSERGALFAFAGVIGRGLRTTGRWLDVGLPLLDLYVEAMSSRMKHFPDCGSDYGGASFQEYWRNLGATIRASAIDGALVFDNRMRLLAMGVKLKAPRLKSFVVPHASGGPSLDLRLKGTRHSSAAAWAAAGRSRMAVVVSQDRYVRIFERNESGELVYNAVRPRLFE
ncbi:MAG: hypothetical protein IPK71_34740 [Myxococcales bacterium]|nr:hypothetical protein [Myxococcales bacterium]